MFSFNRFDIHRLLDKAIKQLSTPGGGSTNKSKHKFIQIVVQIIKTWRTLMSSLQPPFQQSRYTVSQRQQIFTNISRWQSDITTPAIGTHFTVRFYTFFNCRYQALCRCVLYLMETNPSNPIPFIFNRNDNQRFTFSASTALSRMFSSYISFINFHSAHKPITTRSHHGSTQFVEQNPCCFVPFQSQNLLKSQSTYHVSELLLAIQHKTTNATVFGH